MTEDEMTNLAMLKEDPRVSEKLQRAICEVPMSYGVMIAAGALVGVAVAAIVSHIDPTNNYKLDMVEAMIDDMGIANMLNVVGDAKVFEKMSCDVANAAIMKAAQEVAKSMEAVE